MITVWGEGRGFRVVWLLEEMGLPYRLRPVDMLAGVENDPEFLAINPAGFIPALQDETGEVPVIMVESIAIMEYLIARHGAASRHGSLAPAPHDPHFAAYLQFLHLGEAGLAGPLFIDVVSRILAPVAERDNWGARKGRAMFEGRLALVSRQLAEAPYMAGDHFTAADISVVWALLFAQRAAGFVLGAAEAAYVARATDRAGYRRAVEVCEGMRDGWGLE